MINEENFAERLSQLREAKQVSAMQILLFLFVSNKILKHKVKKITFLINFYIFYFLKQN